MLFIAIDATAQNWTKLYDYVDEFAFGLAKVTKGDKAGFVNAKGEVIVPLIYDEAMTFREGKATVRIDNKWGYLDSTGKLIEELKYEEISEILGTSVGALKASYHIAAKKIEEFLHTN